ncbi:hypothetical protein JW710_00510 [Candidatus Dojkabacteria bacterium]|nr:hypothetical protein [Candidatus Dojkabacteria bacterium]
MYTPEELRKKHPQFIYDSYDYSINNGDLHLKFHYRLEPDIKFEHKVTIENVADSNIQQIPDQIIENLVFHVGLTEILNYWKATCSPVILIKCGNLDSNQKKWWTEIFTNGMGEFYFTNKIDFTPKNFVTFVTEPKTHNLDFSDLKLEKNKVLIPVGGGKDSIVTIEVLKKSNYTLACFASNPVKVIEDTISTSHISQIIRARREVDPRLFELNNLEYLNGHIPISLIVGMEAVFCSLIFGFDKIAISNELSSNIGNIQYLGREINHQYSKSFFFEKGFDQYIKKYIAPQLTYFSFLRPLHEIQIARLFSTYKKYFSIFSSCNSNFLQKNLNAEKRIWCCECPKCLFVFMILYPFITRAEIKEIFGKDLYKEESLLPLVKQLIGEEKSKPLECVGTKEESLVALYLGMKKSLSENTYNQSPILVYFKEKILPKTNNLEEISHEIVESWNDAHIIPEDLEELLRKEIE